MAAINEALQPLLELSGLPIDHVKLLLSFFLVTPIGWLQWTFVRGKVARHLYSIVMGLLLETFCFGLTSTLYFLAFSAVPLAMHRLLPKRSLATPTYIYSFALVLSVQLKRILFPGPRWDIDDTGLYMIAILKFISLAYCIQDSETVKTHGYKVVTTQREYTVEKMPTVLEFYSFMCFFPTFIVGPVIEFRHYIEFIELKGQFAAIPPPFVASLTRFMQGMLLIGVVIAIGTRLDYDYIMTDEFYAEPFLYKIFTIWLLGEANRVRFYLAWKFSEAGAIASGYGYKGTSSKGVSWDRVLGIRILGVELASNMKLVFDNWNVATADWLRRYSYERIIAYQENPSKAWKSTAQHLTFALSAIWHGFQPGYLIFFINASVLGEVNKMLYVMDLTYLPGYKFLRLLCIIGNGIMINYLGSSFVLLSLHQCYLGYASLDFLPLILLYGLRFLLKYVRVFGQSAHSKSPEDKR